MSASDKKKLRKENETVFLTERQKAEQAEAKKLKIYTIAFVSAMLLFVVIALGVFGVRAVNNSGVFQKNTVAATIDDTKLNSVELAYYYNDAINKYYNEIYTQFSDYADTYLETLGLRKGEPLTELIQDKETGKTWATYFLEQALNQAKIDYTMSNLAIKDGFQLPEEDKASLANVTANLEMYASISGYGSPNLYLRAIYGYGSDTKSYEQYCERSALASAYISAHHENLSYDDAALRGYEADKQDNYNSYTYDYAYLSYTEFLTGGTESEDGNKTYTDEENNAARAAMKDAADKLAKAKNLEDLKKITAEIKLNTDKNPAINEQKNQLYTAINADLAKWLADAERKDGDVAAIANKSTTKNEDGTEKTEINGYYVALYHSKSDNKVAMSNVRHLLVEFECEAEGEHEHNGYSDAEKQKAKTEAEGYLKTWNEGAKTEDSFIELVKKHSDDSTAESGGLFENVNPSSQFVPNFLNWSISDDRKVGDCEVIESEYGYHVMYYVGDTEMNYRDYMISEEMRAKDHEDWYNGIVDAAKGALSDTSKMKLDVTLG